jgi:LCP family protein required for cell wall assembly
MSARRFGRLGRLGRLRRFGRIPRLESPFAASMLSCLLPGLGQLAVGRGRWALLFLVPSLLGLGWIAVQLSQGLAWFGLSLLDETFVATLIAIMALLAVWRVLAVGHAFLTAPGRRRWPKIESAVVAALVLSITATHVVAMAGAWAVYRAGVAINSNNMLSDSSLAGESPSATHAAPTASPTPTPAPTPTPEATSPLPPWAFSSPSATPAPAYLSNGDRITFLLIGVDLMTGRSHALTDSMILATLDVHTNKATIISVPRDTGSFDLYYGGSVTGGFKLNELMSAASSASFGSPDSGVETLAKEIGFLVGLPVDYYAAVDLEGFVKMVQAIGGVDVNVTTAVNDPFTGTFVPTGLIHMDGHLALKYARSRMSSSDYARASRQQEVLVALARKVVTPEVVPQLPELLSLAGTAITTDFPMKYARNFVTAFRRVDAPTECVLGPPYSYHPDTSTTGGTWISRLDIDRVASLSVYLFGGESLYSDRPGVVPAPCQS